jgi:NRPS condensation-like uncharacterized protein
VLQSADGVAAEPTGVLIGSRAGDRLENVGLGGIVTVSPPIRTSKLYLIFPAVSSAAAGNTAAGQPAQLPVGLAKIKIPALAKLRVATPSPATPFQLACGSGPTLTVDGHRYQTSVRGTIGDLINLSPVQLGLCTADNSLTLAAGRQWLSAAATNDLAVTSISLSTAASSAGQQDLAASPAPRRVQVLSWQADSRRLQVGPGSASYVEIHENVNVGWRASLAGRTLQAATLDGWQQAFIVPAGQGGTITLTYAPAATYHAGIIASAALLAILVMFAIVPRRRRRTGSEPPSPRAPDGNGPRWATAAGVALPTPSGPGPRWPALRRARATPITRTVLWLLPVTAVVLITGGPVMAVVPPLAALAWWRPRWLPAVAAAGFVAAGLVAATARTPTVLGSGPFSGAAQFCALAALAAALMPALPRSAAGTGADRRAGLGNGMRPASPERRGRLADDSAATQPFAAVDELVCYFDTVTEPSTIHLEIRVPARLDRQILRSAVIAAISAHPLASRRRAGRGPLSTSYVWEHPASLDIDPVSFTTFTSAAHLAATRSEFLARSPSLDTAPAALLLMASGQACDYLILNAHHAVMDGLSWLELLRDIGRRYRAAVAAPEGLAETQFSASEFPAPGPLDGAALPASADPSATAPPAALPVTARDFAGWISTRWRGLEARCRPPARIAGERGGGRGCGVHMVPLSDVPTTPRLADGGKATVNEVLVAGLIAAVGRWNADHAKRARPARITVPVNARGGQQPLAAGNLSRLVTISAARPEPGGDLTALLRAVSRQAREATQRTGPQVNASFRGLAAVPLPTAVKRRIVRAALRAAGPLLCDTAMLTNLGKVPDRPDFGQPGEVTMGLSGPAQMPRGLSVGVITAGGRMQLGIRYNRALLDDDAAVSFGATLVTALRELTGAAGPPGTTSASALADEA